MRYTEFTARVAAFGNTKMDDLMFSDRSTKILLHYHGETSRGRMSLSAAVERCWRDICGDNYSPKHSQRSGAKLKTEATDEANG